MVSPSRHILMAAAILTLSLSGCCCSSWFAYWHQYSPIDPNCQSPMIGHTPMIGGGPAMYESASLRQERLARRAYRRVARQSAHQFAGYSGGPSMVAAPQQMMASYPEMWGYPGLESPQFMQPQFADASGCNECSSCSSSAMTTEHSYSVEGDVFENAIPSESYDAPAIDKSDSVPQPKDRTAPAET